MSKVRCHITIDGVPLCIASTNPLSGITCGQPSITAAKEAKRYLQMDHHTVRIVRGDCPEAAV